MAGLVESFFKSPLFTWWNSAGVGTRIFTSRKGIRVGEDDAGNIYYRDKDDAHRWVIYKNGPVEASRIPAEWHGWMHRTVDTPPSADTQSAQPWEKPHQPNMTGTAAAYQPAGVAGKRAASTSDYESWTPDA